MQMLAEILRNLWGKPWFIEVVFILFLALVFLWDKITETERFLRWKVKTKPNDFQAHLNLGMYLAEFEECYNEAETEYQRAISIDPKNKDALFGLYLLLRKSDKKDLAENTLFSLLRDFSDDPHPYVWAGNLFAETNPTISKEYFDKAVSLAPNYSFVLRNYAIFLNNQKEYSEAEKYLKKALEFSPMDELVQKSLVIALSRQRKFAEMEANARKFLNTSPKNKDMKWLLGLSLNSQEKNYEALNEFKEILKIDRNYAFAYNSIGDIYFNLKDFIAAEKNYREALKLEPDDPWLHEALGETLNLMQRFNEAIPYYVHVLSSKPEDIGILIAIACIYRRLENQQELKLYLEKAKQVTKNDDWYNLACIESVGGDSSTAFEYLRKATAIEDFNAKWAWEDPDLQWIRDDPRFVEIVGPKPETQNSEIE